MTPVAQLGALPWVQDPLAQKVLGVLGAAGHQGFFVGGCVRNSLLGVPVQDLDIATDALPEQVMEHAKRAKLKAIGTGIDHGTVTIVGRGVVIEVTTFRKDVATDGRRAVVAFSQSLQDDAARRDFTMNALYADAKGQVFDPLGGLPDLEARRIRFIGSPEARIAEDALRILRFFRFQALYGDPDEGPDAEGLAACAAGAEGLDKLSRERVGHELRKLLGAPNPAPAVATMAQSGVLWRILPGAAATSLAPLVHLEEVYGLAPSWLRRLAALGCDVEACTDQLRLSKEETTSLRKRAEALGDASPGPVRAYRFGLHPAQDAMLIAQSAVPAPPPAGLLDGLEEGAEQQFPLKAADLVPPLTPGRALGHALKTAEEAWVAAEFALSRDSLVALALKAGAAPPQD